MKVSLDEGAVLKLSSLYAGGAAAAALIAPNKFQDTIYDTIVPRASLSVTRHHGIVLAGLSALAAAAVPADRSTQRAALKAAGATWLAQGVLNVYETADGQTKRNTYALAAANCVLGGLCLWSSRSRQM
ncbi:thiamine pyrophosphate-requiring [Micractinium conductrix]|uniref:Thiamine pyrophosphate-requiring n=1 Tax=Micractinium conductrix TaxID=554055 RepID=A0A2P6VBL8_9CHLO|nr:thiamine pyrophosphate-requiring [Micractinium conductrix]|eukprot:PSC71476.1 thiamine pyrophosphate-requiring [Micractinium conductrix]